MITIPQGFDRELAATTSLKSHALGGVASHADFESALTSKTMVDTQSKDNTRYSTKSLVGNINDDGNLQPIKNNPPSSTEGGILQTADNRITSRKSKNSESNRSAIEITNDTSIWHKSTERKRSAHPANSSIRKESLQAIQQSNSSLQKSDASIINNEPLIYVSTSQSVKKTSLDTTQQPSFLGATRTASLRDATISNSVPASVVNRHNGIDGRLSVRFSTNILNVANNFAETASSFRSVESINHIKNNDGVNALETSFLEADGIRPLIDSGIFPAKNLAASNNWELVAPDIIANSSYMRAKGLRSSVRSIGSENQQNVSPVMPLAANKPSTSPEIIPEVMMPGPGSSPPSVGDGKVTDFGKKSHMEAGTVASELSGKISAKSLSASGNTKRMLTASGQSATNSIFSEGRESVFTARSDEHGVISGESAESENTGENKPQTKDTVVPESSTSIFGGNNPGVAQKNVGGEQKLTQEQTAQISPVDQHLKNVGGRTADRVRSQNALTDSGTTAANGDLTQDKSRPAKASVDEVASSNVVNISASKNNLEYTLESNKLHISRAELNRAVSDADFSGYLHSDAYKGKSENAAISSYHNSPQSLGNTISTLETGIGRGPEDWIKVQASKSTEGIHATLSANTTSGSVMLHEKALELQGYLEEKHISVDLDIAPPKLDEQDYGNHHSFSASQGATSNANSERDKGQSYGAYPKHEKEDSHGVDDLVDHEVHPLLQRVGLGSRVSVLA